MISQYPVRTIDLAALRRNVRLLKESLPPETMLMAVVKADAYGHGIVHVSRNVLSEGADWLAVARTDEGAVLREAGITAPILVLGVSLEDELREGIRKGLTLTVCRPETIMRMERYAEEEGCTALMHMKLDTGMGRIGARSEVEIRSVLEALDACRHVRMTGVFTHFADADGTNDDYTIKQKQCFERLLALLPDGLIRHCANSAAIHRYPELAMDMVRAGISMYGVPPVVTAMPLTPVMDWRTAVTYVKDVQQGECISYGCTYTAAGNMRIATIACGYGDGYHRNASGRAQVLIHGKRADVIGRICMDQLMVDVTDIPSVMPGDEVVLMGVQGDQMISAQELGEWSETIGYEVLLAATDRVHRKWIHDCDEQV